jgi:hypothetical protein
MTACPRCGHDNPDGATSCSQCGESLPPTRDSSASPLQGLSGPEPVAVPRPSFWTPLRLYLLGIGLGLIPLAVWLAAWSTGVCSSEFSYWPAPGPGQDRIAEAMWLYVLQLVAGLVCLFSRRTRRVGYGLLTMALVDPVVGVIGCGVIGSHAAVVC